MQNIFVSGGAGYIGSHTVLQLLEQGYEVTVFDNLCNASLDNINQVEQMTGKHVNFIEGDLKNFAAIDAALASGNYNAVIHFAALKSVIDSMSNPLDYYENNVGGTMNLLKAMQAHDIKNIVFSSTASVYGNAKHLPINEEDPIVPDNVYGKTKAMSEKIIEDMSVNGLNSVRLRYFNVAGADISGKIGEDPNAMGNLVPRIFKAMMGTYDLKIFGNQFPTRDGYQIRDYIHVVDLAAAHLSALKYFEGHTGSSVFNLGTGKGTSVIELLHEIEKATGKQIPYEVLGARAGEAFELYADAGKAKAELGWEAKSGPAEISADAWRWYQGKI